MNLSPQSQRFSKMRNLTSGESRSLAPFIWLCVFMFISGTVFAQSSAGLWVGEVTLDRVNETVVGFNAQNQVSAPNPNVTTPVKSPAHLRIILHVDKQGQARLLKNVAILDKSTNSTPNLALV